MYDLIVLADQHSYDVTVVVQQSGRIICRNCRLLDCAVFTEPRAAFLHMLTHVHARHRVRRAVLDGLAVAAAVVGHGL